MDPVHLVTQWTESEVLLFCTGAAQERGSPDDGGPIYTFELGFVTCPRCLQVWRNSQPETSFSQD
jgi:hypothetical protein